MYTAVIVFTYQVKSRFWDEVDKGGKDLQGPLTIREYDVVVADQIVRLWGGSDGELRR